jgi:serralysin
MRINGDWYHGNRLFGTEFNDIIFGGLRDDQLLGLGGNDTLLGYDGNDRMEGGAGADILCGGPGTDRASYEHSGAGVFVNLATGRGYHGDAEGDVLSDIEDLYGSPYNDTLFGNDGPNTIWGDAGIENIRGGDGPDHLYGGAGDDRINGGGNNFSFDFGPLFGGTVSFLAGDVLEGDSGADTFIWTRITDTGVTPEGMDHIVDFRPMVDGDRIDLNAIDANETVTGYQPFTFIGGADFSAPGQVRVIADGWDFIVGLNTDTDPEAEAAIRVSIYPDDLPVAPDRSWFVPWVADHPL